MTKILRSLIHEYFPFELRVDLEVLSKQRMNDQREMKDSIFKLFGKHGVENVVPLGSGTNRYAFKLGPYAIKLAINVDGRIDNMKEFKMAPYLFPDVVQVYEISSNSSIMVSEYVQPFMNFNEMKYYEKPILKILERLSSRYMIGDVGLISNNYANWGLRVGTNNPVCLDFAYVYNVSSDFFMCYNCTSQSMLIPTNDYSQLICPSCASVVTFRDIRMRLGDNLQNHEIGDLTKEGYVLSSSHVLTELDVNRSRYLKPIEIKTTVEPVDIEIVNNIDNDFLIDLLSEGGNNMPKVFNGQLPTEKIFKNNDINFEDIVDDTSTDDVSLFCEINMDQVSEDKAETLCVVDLNNYDAEYNDIIANDDNFVVVDNKEENNMVAPELENYFDIKIVSEVKRIPNIGIPKHDDIAQLISRVSNKIKESVRHSNVYSTMVIKNTPDIAPEERLQCIGTSVYKSLCELLKIFRKTDKSLIIPTVNEQTPHIDTWWFFDRMGHDSELFRESKGNKCVPMYRAKYDQYGGITKDWLPILMKYLKFKLTADDSELQKVVDVIANTWCELDRPQVNIETPKTETASSILTKDEVEALTNIEQDSYDEYYDDYDGVSVTLSITEDMDSSYNTIFLETFDGTLMVLHIDRDKEIPEDWVNDWGWLKHLNPNFWTKTENIDDYLRYNDLAYTIKFADLMDNRVGMYFIDDSISSLDDKTLNSISYYMSLIDVNSPLSYFNRIKTLPITEESKLIAYLNENFPIDSSNEVDESSDDNDEIDDIDDDEISSNVEDDNIDDISDEEESDDIEDMDDETDDDTEEDEEDDEEEEAVDDSSDDIEDIDDDDRLPVVRRTGLKYQV